MMSSPELVASPAVPALPVLIVDDDRMLLRTIGDLLRLSGYETVGAASGREGLETAARLAPAPAVALVDLRLPDMDGIELVGKLRAVSELMQVVILTGNATIDSAVRALREQSYDYLVKPVQPDQLVRSIERAEARFQRRRAELAQRESEERLRRIFDHVSDALFITDDAGTVLDANPGACELTGLPLEALRHRHLDAVVRRAAPPESGEHRATVVRADGSERIVDVHPAAFAPGQLVHTVQDLTDRHRLEEELHQTRKMDAIGRLAGGIAHDFNNMLTAVKSYAQLLLEDLPAGDRRRDDVSEINRAADRAAALTRQLLAFSRRQVMQPRLLDLNATVEEMQKMLQRLITESIRFETRLDRRLGAVRADPGQLEQVLMNLVVNARDAMPDGGTITITTGNVDVDPEYAAQHGAAEIPPGPYVVLDVTDTGHGMDRATRERIFEPFFTTKEKGRGTGLGLSTVYGIVQQSGGHLWVYSEPGIGTTFRIYLPRVAEAEGTVAPAAPAPSLHRGTGTILLVEDDAAVRSVIVRILRRAGYDVIETRDGEDAIARCDAASPAVDLVLTDMIMPGMGGRELARILAERHPEIRTLFMSGYTEDSALRRNILEPGMAFIQKPFSPEGLTAKVREMLG